MEDTLNSGQSKDTKDIVLSEKKEVDQDYNQKRDALIALCLEVYRVIMGSCLILFVPQKCNDTSCGLSENINRIDDYSVVCLSFNAITMVAFLFLYAVEFKRESKLISYLEVNKNKPMDNESISEELTKLDISYKNILWNLDYYYKVSGYISLVSFITNAILSAISIYSRYLDQTTITVFLTNILFMTLKIHEVISIVYTDKNVFLSAFLTERVQYNDVDPDKLNKQKKKYIGWMFLTPPPPPTPRNSDENVIIQENRELTSSDDTVDSKASTVISGLNKKDTSDNINSLPI
tara:strand:- start:1460 stop:2335 length:876 start_codon:yes stop_codon:yes gene_type:complete